jgi:metal-responsive CopG/Arc/MetJ family transcriptional regulator
MLAIKTAISIEKVIFDQAEKVAQAMNVSRSKLFVLALQEFLERQKNKELLAQINAAYADLPDAAEQTVRNSQRRHHRRIVESEEW